MSTILYAAYGSNLNHEQMAMRCPKAKFVGSGQVPGIRLVFRNVADVETDPLSDVLVGLWRVSKDCLRALDRYEGYPSLYDRTIVDVNASSGQVAEAWIYFMNASNYSLPQKQYYRAIQQGYKDCNLDVQKLVYAVNKTFWLAREKITAANIL